MHQETDTVRASRDGHEYHEAWTARKALQLLWADSKLVGIAVEGLSPTDQARASAKTVQIADITLYFGGHPAFKQADRLTIAQFKYSIANEDEYFRASRAKETIEKFGNAYRDLKTRYGAEAVQKKLDFQLITNQPIYEPLLQAVEAIAKGLPRTGEVEKQARQFEKASGLQGKPLVSFAAKCNFIGRSKNLAATKYELACLLVDWSATKDALARARLAGLKELVRNKAGHAGSGRNVIRRTDILAALEVSDPDDLLPCKPALTDVGPVVERHQLSDAVSQIESLQKPLLIHSAGGVGKTVFMESLAGKIQENYEVVFFDCFGGGAYRALEDARHLPRNGLMHIANTLAFRSLCDPILPHSSDPQTLLKTFRRRLTQCVETISRMNPGRSLALFIDAIDNADIAAKQRGDDSFPVELIQSLDTEPIPGVKLIVSCRTERKPDTYAEYDELELQPFNINETSTFLRARMNNVSQGEISIAQARSGGNPRVLDYLLMSGRGLLDESEVNKKFELNDLIEKRIKDALTTARVRGYKKNHIDAFLAGLAVLPPPVPLNEYAGIHKIELSAIESFASDLFPLLERTNQGLMFRDEPTETLIQKRYASSNELLRHLAENLLVRQDVSVYAARALPGLLHQLDDGERLFKLAFDDRIPATITSTVGKRNIRFARLKAATLHAAMKKDYDRLVKLLMELSTIAVVDQRGAAYILDHPELVIALKDIDATRRLFETRSAWQGTRHARLTIANTLSGDLEEARRHARTTDEWLAHWRNTDRKDGIDEPGPELPDIAAIPFFLISKGGAQDAVWFLEGWKDWYAFEVCEYIFNYCYLAQAIGSQSPDLLSEFVDALTQVGPLAAALSFAKNLAPRRRKLIIKLADVCRKATELDGSDYYRRERTYVLQDGLLKAAADALMLGLNDEALSISLRATHQRPGIWSFRERFHNHREVFPFIFRAALVAAAENSSLHEKDVLPKELVPICARIRRIDTGKAFHDKFKARLARWPRKQIKEDDEKMHPHALSDEGHREAENFINSCLEPLLSLAKALSSTLAAPENVVDKVFVELIETWDQTSKKRDSYLTDKIDHFFHKLGLDVVVFALWVRTELKAASVKSFLTAVHSRYIDPEDLIRLVSILAEREPLQTLAGEQAQHARKLIQAADDVSYRASLYSRLARALLPASIHEASNYFREGLEQMDAIGSGDDQFTNELLLFASSLKGDELSERDFHTLSNISELNMGEQPEKFFWGAFGRGLSKTAGVRGLAKLSRWDDRSKISLSYTLLPYLTALLEQGKIEPKDALALNRLARPVGHYHDPMEDFTKAIHDRAGPDSETITALIQQFEDDNPGLWMGNTIDRLVALAGNVLGFSSKTARHLRAARKLHEEVRNKRNERNYNWDVPNAHVRKRTERGSREDREALKCIAKSTDPTDQSSLNQAITTLDGPQHTYELKDNFFAVLRAKVPFGARAKYIENICELEHLLFDRKIEELKGCKQAWTPSSASLNPVYEGAGIRLIQLHADEMIAYGMLSGSRVREISDLTGIADFDLVLELIKVFGQLENTIAGAVWLTLASFICRRAKAGMGEDALTRLLRSPAAELADNVADGKWKDGLYPRNDITAVAAGLLWRVLGSPYAVARWRAAHSIRCLAAFGRWQIIDHLVGNIESQEAGPFQAPELTFYYLHARLWLLIALARMARDYPEAIARYKDILFSIATEQENPHALMRHFAAQALLTCVDAGRLQLQANMEKLLRNVNLSPHPRLKKKIRTHDFYSGRPKTAPSPEFKFDLDYDFHKHDVDNLSHVFGQPCWKVVDMISAIVHELDPNVTSMYESGGRESYNHRFRGITTRYHGYGQQLGWHALFFAAGKLLATAPVTDDWWCKDDPWGEWLGRYLLTRQDGLWLSDGTERVPLDTIEPLLEKKKGLVVTSDRDTLLRLAGVTTRIGKELVVGGRWFSADGIKVGISSALVAPDKAVRAVRKLIREEPMLVWIPAFHGAEDDLDNSPSEEKKEYTPWIVCPYGEARLDEHDPYGVPCANFRPRLARALSDLCSITSTDPFGRVWRDKRGRSILRAQAWGRENRDSGEDVYPGHRLLCSSSVLKKILNKYDKNLLLLIKLERYEKKYQELSKWTHTIAVVRITKALKLQYFKGRINHLHKSEF
ncbi:MAG: transcriptional regulator [Candidatus Abyssobacteria bacterium SURF_5]|uniref:Transcriptional regulator n=1 Tax=Abyssobacteria bacterium (strain SURF_5) TaxID=2093360 RepID=A0A3A4N9Z4_ABYX5|nr:MAG: transcriptional regulator [Candidatus Abyssubacteria bacterium SURF_5]